MVDLAEDLRLQMVEALGPTNKWYASKYYGYEVTDPNLLMTYYIKYGGAKDFRIAHPLNQPPSMENKATHWAI